MYKQASKMLAWIRQVRERGEKNKIPHVKSRDLFASEKSRYENVLHKNFAIYCHPLARLIRLICLELRGRTETHAIIMECSQSLSFMSALIQMIYVALFICSRRIITSRHITIDLLLLITAITSTLCSLLLLYLSLRISSLHRLAKDMQILNKWNETC